MAGVTCALMVAGALALLAPGAAESAETASAEVPPVAEVPAAPAPVAVERDRITGEFSAVSAEDALRQIASATGADVVGTVLEGRQVTVKLDDVPLEHDRIALTTIRLLADELEALA